MTAQPGQPTPAGQPSPSGPPPEPINLADYEALARDRLEASVYDYYAGGADDEQTIRDNRAAFERIRLRPRVLVDVSQRSITTRAFDRELPHPLVVAPTARHVMAHPDGELATARGAADAGAILTLSTVASRTLEEVAGAAPGGARWFQLYTSSRGDDEQLVRRAVAAGYGALVLTVDLPYPGRRERDIRHGFVLPLGAHLAEEHAPEGIGYLSHPTLSWDDLAWLRSVCEIPMLVKGVLRADDALRAVDAGVDGIWVSNHGGRQLDGSIAAVDALPEIAAAVAGRALLVVDGGVRRGTDALKALARGADLVAVGRPALWGLAVGGAAGVSRVLSLLTEELSLAMALAGCRSLDEVTPDLLV